MRNGINQRRIALVTAVLLFGCSEPGDPDGDGGVLAGTETGEVGGDDDGEADEHGPEADGGETETTGPDEDEVGGDDEDEVGGDGDGDGDGADGGLPNNPYCQPVAAWDPTWVSSALAMIEQINAARALGGSCGELGEFPAADPLVWEPALTCAARVHSQDMAVNNFFSQTNLEGKDASWRVEQAGYVGANSLEIIGAGYADPLVVAGGWLGHDGFCAALLDGGFVEVGVGYAFGANAAHGHYWTLVLGGE